MRRFLLTTALSVAMISSVLAVSPPNVSAQADDPIDVGISVTESRNNLVTEAEVEIGRDFDFVRVFKLWDDQFPTSNDLELLDGRNIMLSIRARGDNGEVPWEDIGSAQPGDPLYQDMVDWAEALAPYEDQLWITFHHEPEALANSDNGTDVDFISAWRNFMTIMDAEGFDPIGRIWIMTDYSFQVADVDRRAAQKWYPGDEWVEGIAADAYNWYECRDGFSLPWFSLEHAIEGLRLFGEAHPDEELMLAEFGSADDTQDPARKGEWFDDARALFAQPGYEQFTAISYFSLDWNIGIFDCDWRFNSSPEAGVAFAGLVNDPTYGGEGPIFEPPGPEPEPEPGPECTATAQGSGFDLVWTGDGTAVILRDGTWVTTVTGAADSHFDAGGLADSTYQIRLWNWGERTDLECVIVGTPVEPEPEPGPECTATAQGSGFDLVWTGDGTAVILRDGTWVTTVTGAADSHFDAGGLADSTYQIRLWSGGVRTEIACVTVGTPDEPPELQCTATTAGNTVTLEWNAPGRPVILRNGSWLITLPDGTTTFDDVNPPPNSTHVLRTWPGPVDYDCELQP